MTPDNELPVWPFMPNWRGGIIERLTWATGVLGSDSGAEQAFSSRLSPRREFEATFNPVDDVRTFFDLFISELGGQEMMIPLWHDVHKTTAVAASAATRIDCHTEYGEFVAGGMAILVGADPWSHEVVEIEAVDGTGLDIVDGLSAEWLAGSVILPLRRSRLDLQPSMSGITSKVADSTLLFALNQANDLPDLGAWSGMTLDGYPVLERETNWIEPVEMGFSRIMETEDNGTGIPFMRDLAERAFRTKKHIWHLRGRQDNWEFRQFLYRMGGRRVPIWIPTGNRDMVVAANAAAGANNVQVRRVGLSYVGGPQPGRDRFLARTADGSQARTIGSMGVPSLPTYERINVTANLTYALPAGTVLSFLEIMRAEGDSIELLHHTDVEGMTECTINFRSFSNTRNPAGSNFLPLPTGVKQVTGCGEPAEGENPCIPPAFDGWYIQIRVNWINLISAEPNLGCYLYRGEGTSVDRYETVAQQYIEWRQDWPGSYDAQGCVLQSQFGGGTTSATKGQVVYRRWDETNWHVASPLPGSDSPDEGGGWWDVYNVGPVTQLFNF